jgi:NAD-dependent dihydropyrimidine dehydrogenase PreA subunit
MPYVITEACIGICDTACVEVCPVDCIMGPVATDAIRAMPAPERHRRSVRLFIDAEACICCGACEPECPVGAIVEDETLPRDAPAIVDAADFFRSANQRASNAR